MRKADAAHRNPFRDLSSEELGRVSVIEAPANPFPQSASSIVCIKLVSIRKPLDFQETVGEGFIPSRNISKSRSVARAGIKPAPTTDQKHTVSGWTLVSVRTNDYPLANVICI
jgi:hypothetical protein